MKKKSKILLLFICTFILTGKVDALTGSAQYKSKTQYRYQYSFKTSTYKLYAHNMILKGTNHPIYTYNIGTTEKDLYDIYDNNIDMFVPKEDFEKIKEIVYYGDKVLNESSNPDYLLVTYGLMVKALKPDKFSYSKYQDKEPTFFDELEASLQEEIDNYFLKPSFNNKIKNIDVNKSLDIIDENSMLKTYELDSINGDSVSYKIGDNKISLKALKPGTTTFKFKKEYHDKDYNMELLSSTKGFGVTAGNFVSYITYNINVLGGRIALDIKDDSDLKDSKKLDVTYGIYNKEDKLVYQIHTDTEGFFYTSYLPNGSYYVKEIKNNSAYEKNKNIYQVNINNDEQIVSISNHKKKVTNTNNNVKENLRNITIKFVNEEGKMINDSIKFSIMDKTFKYPSKNNIILEDGNYILKILEVPDDYIIDDKDKIISVNDDMDVLITLKYKEEGFGSLEVPSISDNPATIKSKEEVEEIAVPDTFSFNYLFIFLGLSYVKKFSKR